MALPVADLNAEKAESEAPKWHRPRGSRLRSGRRSPDHDEIDRAARPAIVEDANHQPSGPPRLRVEVSAALVQLRAVGIIIMAVHDVEITKAFRKSLGIALPQQRHFALPLQGNVGIDAAWNVEAMGVDMHQPQPIEPGEVAWPHVVGGGPPA